jgi:hypothetical protein
MLPGHNAALRDVVVVMTDGLALLAAWCGFGLLLGCRAERASGGS